MKTNKIIFIFDKHNHFNLANIVTFLNIIFAIFALYFIFNKMFFYGALFAWFGGLADIVDGKIARKYNLSTQFGVQLDSFADFFAFIIVPCVFLYFSIFVNLVPDMSVLNKVILAFSFIYYIISGTRRLISFNINAKEDECAKFFVGMPTPMGAICLWLVYLLAIFGIIQNILILFFLIIMIAYLLNSKIKIPHL